MRKRIIIAVLLLAMLLSVTSCGNSLAAGGETKEPAETTSRPADGAEQTKAPEGEDPQPSEGPETVETRYIFSDRPLAAYEVTGLDLKNVYEGIYTEADGTAYSLPIAKLTPGENPFIIFCMPAENNPDYPRSVATVHSPAGSGQWEGTTYSWRSTFDEIIDPVPEVSVDEAMARCGVETA